MSIVDNQRPLQPEYVPGTPKHRKPELETLIDSYDAVNLPNTLLHGPRGTGKTLLTRKLLTELEDDIQHHYINCINHDTEHKALRKLHASITGKEPGPGFHTSKLKRKIQKQTEHTRHAIILDEADFLLLNNGNSLLYFLSRLKNPGNTGIIIVSAHTSSLEDRVDERTYSTLQPRRIGLEPYTPEQVYEILGQRARQSLEPTSLHHEALTYLASTTQNLKHGLHWLRHTAQQTSQPITEEHLRQNKQQVRKSLVEKRLAEHGQHHRVLYSTVQSFDDYPVNSGQVYTKYREHCNQHDTEPLSNRRISDLIQQLELHNLLRYETHHGGQKGKTREITPTQF